MNIKELQSQGYVIENAKIGKVNLSMADHGCLTLYMELDGEYWGCVYGGYCLGHGYLGAEEFYGAPDGLEYIMRIMDTIGVEKFNDMEGKFCRVATNGWGSPIKIIGNIMSDKWFDAEEFFKEEK